MSKDFQQIMEIACSHHEKFDGSGYYRHLKGEDIPFLDDGYKGEYIKDIAQALINEGKNFDDIDFKKESHTRILETIKKDLLIWLMQVTKLRKR